MKSKPDASYTVVLSQYLLFGLVSLVDKMSTSERHFCAFRPDTHPVSSDDDDGVDGGVDDGDDIYIMMQCLFVCHEK